MKGLFVKDLRLMMIQGRVMAVVVVMVLVIWGIMGIADGGAVLGYVMVVLSIYIPSLISYDEMDNGYAWIFTMPASRREYVLEKYIFGILCLTVGILLCAGAGMIQILALGAEQDPEEWLFTCGVFLLIGILFQALVMPFRLKYEGDKGRVVMFAAIAVFVLLFYGAVRLAGMFSDDVIGQIMSFLAGLGVAGMLGCGAVITAAAVVISVLCSCRIMEKREF